MEFFASFVYHFPLMFIQPMHPLKDGVSYVWSTDNYMVLHLPKSFIENANMISYLINKSVT
jgi:hypothetical protein